MPPAILSMKRGLSDQYCSGSMLAAKFSGAPSGQCVWTEAVPLPVVLSTASSVRSPDVVMSGKITCRATHLVLLDTFPALDLKRNTWVVFGLHSGRSVAQLKHRMHTEMIGSPWLVKAGVHNLLPLVLVVNLNIGTKPFEQSALY